MKTAKSTKGQSRLCTLGGRIRERVRRFLSITLCISMAVCGMPAIPALAEPINEDDEVQEFTLAGADISAAMAKAMKGDPVSEEDYRFFGAMEETYEELFYGSEETAIDIYELFPKIEKDKDGSLSLRIFLRIDESERKLDASGFTGEEQLIFLLLNSGKEEQTARVYVDDNMTGLIKVAPRKDVVLDKADLTDEVASDAEEAEEAVLAGAEAAYEDKTGAEDAGAPDIAPPSSGGPGAGTGAGAGSGAGGGIGAGSELPDHDDRGDANDAEESDDGTSDHVEGDPGDDGLAYDEGVFFHRNEHTPLGLSEYHDR